MSRQLFACKVPTGGPIVSEVLIGEFLEDKPIHFTTENFIAVVNVIRHVEMISPTGNVQSTFYDLMDFPLDRPFDFSIPSGACYRELDEKLDAKLIVLYDALCAQIRAARAGLVTSS